MTWPNGERYEGEWLDGRKHGSGKMQYVDGRAYIGAWVNDKKSGAGVMTWPNGRTCNSIWTNDTASCEVQLSLISNHLNQGGLFKIQHE
jgi:hypothetical protein